MTQIKPQVKFAVKHIDQQLVQAAMKDMNNRGMSSDLGTIIKTRLKSLKKTQGWLAEEAGVSDTAVSKWIATGRISRENAKDIANILGLSLDELLGVGGRVEDAPPTLALVYVNTEELRLLTAYREANDLGKALINAAADGAPRNESLDLITIRNKS